MTRDDHGADPAALRSLLAGAASRYGVDDAAAVGTLWKRWVDIVGPDVAAHAEPTSLRSGTLRVRADSPVWAHEIGYLTAEIATRANESLGRDAVAEVKVWNAPGKTSPNPIGGSYGAHPRRASPEPDPEVLKDPLSALERARRAWLQGRHKGRGEYP